MTAEQRKAFAESSPEEILSAMMIVVIQERERCAAVADEAAKCTAPYEPMSASLAIEIAKRIRKG